MKDLPEEFLLSATSTTLMRHLPATNWRRSAVTASVPLGALKAGTRILPCLSGQKLSGRKLSGRKPLSYRISLRSKEQPDCLLAKMAMPDDPPAEPDANKEERKDNWASSHVDWFEINADVENASLAIDCDPPRALKKAQLHCSFRAKSAPDSAAHSLAKGSDELEQTPKLDVPALSQMVLEDDIKHRTCAPVCMAMVMAYHGVALREIDFIAQNRHTETGLYGVWPLNVIVLNYYGMSASVRFFSGIDELAALLRLGLPVAVSIAFAEDQLPGAPLLKTGGHVLVVTGIENGKVYVNDPAAESLDDVPRAYDLQAFRSAWLNHHGIGYIISRHD